MGDQVCDVDRETKGEVDGVSPVAVQESEAVALSFPMVTLSDGVFADGLSVWEDLPDTVAAEYVRLWLRVPDGERPVPEKDQEGDSTVALCCCDKLLVNVVVLASRLPEFDTVSDGVTVETFSDSEYVRVLLLRAWLAETVGVALLGVSERVID